MRSILFCAEFKSCWSVEWISEPNSQKQRTPCVQLADKVYFKKGSCYFAQIKFYKKDSATEQRAPSGRELSSEARLKEPAGDYATIFDKDVAFDARGLLPPPTVVPLPPGGRPYYHRLCTFCQIQLKETTVSSA